MPKFFYIIPDFQNPSGATCSAEKRRRVVALSQQYEFTLLEDAPYRLLRYRGTATDIFLAPNACPYELVHRHRTRRSRRFHAGKCDTREIAKVVEDTYLAGRRMASHTSGAGGPVSASNRKDSVWRRRTVPKLRTRQIHARRTAYPARR